ncbi:MAG TPA: hypothetical protein VF257_19515 [Solirubrobacteraceae bacterium]
MSRVDALPADQRSVLDLLLRQGKGYDDLSSRLHIDTGEARSRAYDALDALGPGAGGLPAARRQQIADWLLGQQAPEEASATRAFVDGSSAGRAWAEAVARQLEPLAGGRLPDVPPGEAAAPDRPAPPEEAAAAERQAPLPDGAAAPGEAARPDGEPLPDGMAAPAPRVSRRGGAVLIGAVAAAILAGVLALVLRGGGDDQPARTAVQTTSTTSTKPQVKAQVNLVPPKGGPAARAIAIVQVVDVSGQQAVNAVAQGLDTTGKGIYAIWAYTSPSEARVIGAFDKADDKGHLVYQGALPQDITDITRYREILVTREAGASPERPGTIYLRGPMQRPTGG